LEGGIVIDKDTPVYMISVVAKIAGVHPQTLRFYESEGLIKPSRTEGKTRLYSERDLLRIKRIVSLTRKKGVNVAGTHLILNLEDDLENLFNEISKRIDEETKRLLISILEELNFSELDKERILEILKNR
jgi:MerR family transcriptional regulator/heat shock protein HspR